MCSLTLPSRRSRFGAVVLNFLRLTDHGRVLLPHPSVKESGSNSSAGRSLCHGRLFPSLQRRRRRGRFWGLETLKTGGPTLDWAAPTLQTPSFLVMNEVPANAVVTCQSCRWFRPSGYSDCDTGTCHGTTPFLGGFPVVHREDFCASHKPAASSPQTLFVGLSEGSLPTACQNALGRAGIADDLGRVDVLRLDRTDDGTLLCLPNMGESRLRQLRDWIAARIREAQDAQ